MTQNDLCYLELVEVGKRIRARDVSSVEVTQAILDRVERVDSRLLSFATVTAELALEAAAEADHEIGSGTDRGPLHGVPIAVKDLFNTKGIATTAGMPIHKNYLPDRDATVVSRLKAAGAVLLGKLQMTEGAFGAHHPTISPPVNPWGAQFWTGVSSSGSGVATAAGLCYGSLGTDTLGSIRFPSHMNGLTGLKPTWGRVSRAGVFPLAATLDHVGPMCRSAADAAVMFGAIAGPDSDDPTALQASLIDYFASVTEEQQGIRFGIDHELISAHADRDTTRVLDGASTTFEQLGATVHNVTFPASDEIAKDASLLCAVEAAVAHAATFPSLETEYGPVLAAFLRLGRDASGLAIATILQERARFSGQLAALYQDVDLLLVPAMPVAGLTLAWMAERASDAEARYQRIRFATPFNLSGNPSLTLPGGFTDDGVPIGFQIVGKHLDEALVLRAGHAFQQATNWHKRHPKLD